MQNCAKSGVTFCLVPGVWVWVCVCVCVCVYVCARLVGFVKWEGCFDFCTLDEAYC